AADHRRHDRDAARGAAIGRPRRRRDAARRSVALRATGCRRGRVARRHRRGAGLRRGAARDRLRQCRADGDAGGDAVRTARHARPRQRAERILSHRHRRGGAASRPCGACCRGAGRGHGGGERSRRSGGDRGRDAAAAARAADGGRRDAAGAGDRVPRRRHADRPGQRHWPQRDVRAGRDGRPECRDSRLLPYRGRGRGRGRADRPVRATAARGRTRQGRAYRQFRRGQEFAARGRGEGQPSRLYRRRRYRRAHQYRRGRRHLQLRRRRQASHRDRRGCVRRHECVAGRADPDRGRRHRRGGQRHHRGRAGGRAGARPRAPGDEARRRRVLAQEASEEKSRETLMCGIIGIVGRNEVAPLLVDGLRRLEYRGYDSAGVATLVGGRIERRRAEGKLDRLAALLARSPLAGRTGIAHTRWAAHGAPSEKNAHPIASDRVAVGHNGIIENFQALKDELIAKGHRFETDTDTEAVVHLVTQYLREGLGPVEAVAKTLPRLEGAFALLILFAGDEDLLIGARRNSPLAVGFGAGEMYLGSDALALAPLTRRILYLEEGDWAEVRRDGVTIRDAANRIVERPVRETALSGAAIGKGGHAHYMKKEIFEQPAVIGDTLNAFINPATHRIVLPDLPFDLAAAPKITILACGTAYHAGLVAKYWIEQVARLSVEVDVASEFRYREAALPEGGVTILVSQSGETADTLASLRYARNQGQHIIGVVNQPESTIARESDVVLGTKAGPEIGVASTKAFTTQLAVLACFSIALARARNAIGRDREAALSAALAEVPGRAGVLLNHDGAIAA